MYDISEIRVYYITLGIQALVFELLLEAVVSEIGQINESTVYCLLGYVAAVFEVYEVPQGNSHYIL